MDIGVYQSAASLSALERWQDAVAQNITSGQVTGYRQRTVEFSGQPAGNFSVDPANDSDGVAAVFPTTTNGISFKGGEPQATGNDLDIALQGQGFFEVMAPDGTHHYTRDGEFKLRADHTLINTANEEVLSDAGSPIMLPGEGKITINPDGSVVQGTTLVSRISVQKFADQSLLAPVSGGEFIANPGADASPVMKPQLLQGFLESSNVAPMREMVNLVLISRAYDANQHVITAADEQMQKELDALG
ncbi:MAG TPA: flagellar hook basal-body protein [Opitutaceae bacterium]|nr:flagellar hook basal-body protein [Opitutaceae bacterium]